MRRKILFFLITTMVAPLSLAFGIELFFYLRPIPTINRPHLNRIFETPEFRVHVRTNSLGMRQDDEMPSAKSPGEKRIILIGDSKVFGIGLEVEQAIPGQLQQYLDPNSQQYRVINASAAATGPLQYAQRIRTVAIPYHADTAVVFFYAGNDLQDTLESDLVFPYSLKNPFKLAFPNTYLWLQSWRNNKPLPQYAARPQIVGYDAWNSATLFAWGKRIGLAQEEICRRITALSPTARHWLDHGWINPSLVYSALIRPQELNDISTLKTQGLKNAMRQCQKSFQDMKRLCDGSGIRLVMVLIPSAEQIDDEKWEVLRTLGFDIKPSEITQTKPQDALRDFCRHQKIPYLDLLPALKQAAIRPLCYAVGLEWKPATARHVAEVLMNFLKDNGAL